MKSLNKFGFPKTWSELVSLKSKLSHCGPNLVRYDDDLSFYQQYVQQVPLDIRLRVLDKSIGKGDIRLCRNAFPYLKLIQHLEGVVHYCLWSRIGKLSPKTIEAKIKSKFPGKDFFWFENSPTTKSIPQVWHCQVFIKLK